MGYLDWLPSPAAKAPPWLTRGWGGRWLEAAGLFFDLLAESARHGVKLRFPTYAAKHAPDALEAIGSERLSPRATAVSYEVDTAYGERLRDVWSVREWQGSKTGLKRIVEVLGLSSFFVYDQGEWNPSKPWNHEWVYVDQPNPWGPHPVIGPGWKIGDYRTIGSTASLEVVENVKNVCASWVPAHVRCSMVVNTSGLVIGGGWDVGDGSVLGGNSCAWRLDREIY